MLSPNRSVRLDPAAAAVMLSVVMASFPRRQQLRRLMNAARYDAHPIEHKIHHLTMLAYDMNDEPLPFGHGAPLRLRNENELGFKMVKWIKVIGFVGHYSEIGGGYGGYNQDHEFFGYRQSI
jgi:DMSO/TMAO reductase YedYZ molybdopterin-dependent catalytic subunit